jgi:hypothetical protein
MSPTVLYASIPTCIQLSSEIPLGHPLQRSETHWDALGRTGTHCDTLIPAVPVMDQRCLCHMQIKLFVYNSSNVEVYEKFLKSVADITEDALNDAVGSGRKPEQLPVLVLRNVSWKEDGKSEMDSCVDHVAMLLP